MYVFVYTVLHEDFKSSLFPHNSDTTTTKTAVFLVGVAGMSPLRSTRYVQTKTKAKSLCSKNI